MGSTRAREAMKKLTESRSTNGMITVRRTYRGGVELRVLPLRGVCAWLVAGLLVVGLVFGLLSGRATAATYGFSEEEARFTSAGVPLEGTILVPNGEGRKPAMALVHAAGLHTREDYRAEAEAFATGGIVTLIFDKLTKGYSGFDSSYELLASDALAAVRALRARPDVNPDAVGLWGLSEGGWVVPIAASHSDEVAFIVLVAATGVPPAQSRALPWLLLQALALTTGASILALATSWWFVRKMVTGAERVRIGFLLAGGVVFVAWAAYWGLLVP